jgi:signal peptidase I
MTVLESETRALLEAPAPRGTRVRSALGDLAFLVGAIGVAVAVHLYGPRLSVVVSSSMVPTIAVGDVAVVLPWADPGVGDIAQFLVPLAPDAPETTVPIAHRIIGSDNEGFITKGDNPQNRPDYWRVEPEQIEGQVVFTFPQVWLPRISSVLIGLAMLLALWPVDAQLEEDQDDPRASLPSRRDPLDLGGAQH